MRSNIILRGLRWIRRRLNRRLRANVWHWLAAMLFGERHDIVARVQRLYPRIDPMPLSILVEIGRKSIPVAESKCCSSEWRWHRDPSCLLQCSIAAVAIPGAIDSSIPDRPSAVSSKAPASMPRASAASVRGMPTSATSVTRPVDDPSVRVHCADLLMLVRRDRYRMAIGRNGADARDTGQHYNSTDPAHGLSPDHGPGTDAAPAIRVGTGWFPGRRTW